MNWRSKAVSFAVSVSIRCFALVSAPGDCELRASRGIISSSHVELGPSFFRFCQDFRVWSQVEVGCKLKRCDLLAFFHACHNCGVSHACHNCVVSVPPCSVSVCLTHSDRCSSQLCMFRYPVSDKSALSRNKQTTTISFVLE